MNLYTLSKLTDDIDLCIDNSLFYSKYYSLTFTLLKNTGCRPFELFDPDRWQIYDNNNISLQPGKGNNLRIIPNNLIPSEILQSIADGDIITSRLSLSSVQRYFKLSFPNLPLYISSNNDYQPISLYVMRHRAFKIKYIETNSISATGQYFGEINPLNTSNYINSNLYYS